MPDASSSTPKFLNEAHAPGTTMLLALGGWMDGGSVSTGTVRNLMSDRLLVPVAMIQPAGFYIDHFPGSMELANLLRPHVEYENGLIRKFEMHRNEVHADVGAKLAFFIGKEPNLNWVEFADQVFAIAHKIGVTRIIFMGSFGGSVPHTREPRLFGSVSSEKLLPLLKQYGLKPTEYDGPASFATYLMTRAPEEGIEMLSISVEIPNYLDGTNPLSIEAVTRRLGTLLGVPVDFDALREASREWEAQVTEAVANNKRLARDVRKLEDEYDNELVEAMGEE
jgi:proteasome assembly chaperone (PAC2) family protein